MLDLYDKVLHESDILLQFRDKSLAYLSQTSKAHPKTICYLIKKTNLTISFFVLHTITVKQ